MSPLPIRGAVVLFLAALSLHAQPCTIHTIAGPATTFAGEGQPASSARFYRLHGLSPDKNGNLYVADTGNNRIRRVRADGIVETIAGTGVDGYSGDGGPGNKAHLSQPEGVAVASDGSVYISDTLNNRIRRVNPDGRIETIAGNGQAGFSGDGGPAALATLNTPRALAIDRDGNLYFADWFNNRVRRIDVDGTIRTVAGNGSWVQDLTFVPNNTLGLGIVVTPVAIAVDSRNNLYIAQTDGLIRIDAEGFAHPDRNSWFGVGIYPRWTAVSVDNDDTVVLLGQASIDQVLVRRTPDGKLKDIAHGPFGEGAAIGPDGRIFVDRADDTVGVVMPGKSEAVTFAGIPVRGTSGDNGPAGMATLRSPTGIALGKDGSIYVADSMDYRVRRIGKDGVIRPFAGNGSIGSSGDGGPATSAQLGGFLSVAADATGNVYIAETGGGFGSGRIRMVKPDGSIVTVLGGGGVQVVTSDPAPLPSIPAANAIFAYPSALAVAADGTLYVVAFNLNGTTAGLLRLTSDGRVAQVFSWRAQFSISIVSLAIDRAGNVYTAGRIRTPSGLILSDAFPRHFEFVTAVAFDSLGNKYVGNGRQLGKVSPDGIHRTIYNADLTGFSGELGPDSAAHNMSIAVIASDDAGNLYIADETGRVRKMEAGACPVFTPPVIRDFGSPWGGNQRTTAPIAPGALLSIYGESLGPEKPAFTTLTPEGLISTQLAGVRVLFNGVPAPLLYVSASQINVIVPFSVLRDVVRMEVEREGVKSDAWATTASPAALSVSGAIRLGSVITIWVSGAGNTNPPGVDGRLGALPLAGPALPLSIDIGGTPLEILYAGSAPGLVEGVMQVNFRYPGDVTATLRLAVGSDSTYFGL